jgi:hypothetical protein
MRDHAEVLVLGAGASGPSVLRWIAGKRHRGDVPQGLVLRERRLRVRLLRWCLRFLHGRILLLSAEAPHAAPITHAHRASPLPQVALLVKRVSRRAVSSFALGSRIREQPFNGEQITMTSGLSKNSTRI